MKHLTLKTQCGEIIAALTSIYNAAGSEGEMEKSKPQHKDAYSNVKKQAAPLPFYEFIRTCSDRDE